MMMTPALATALIYRNGENSYATFAQHAQYLFDREEQEWHNLAKRTFECTKFMMSVKFASILIAHGKEGIGNFVTQLYDLGRLLDSLVKERALFEMAHEPETNIVCFRAIKEGLSDSQLNEYNRRVREKLLHEEKYYIVQTTLNGKLYLRATLMNPFTTKEDLNGLLDYLEALGDNIEI
jgi:L-2,4-diaminobutyrate decarboxylase